MTHEEEPRETGPRKNPRVDSVWGSGGLHRVHPEPEKAILEDMGAESIKNEIVNSSVAVMKLLEIVSFLNGRECQYLTERDTARK
ncbi:hypothetical protein A2U01_0050200, partial [Trifolium medium]|nr:hypothetical protein [Trifolium medium]